MPPSPALPRKVPKAVVEGCAGSVGSVVALFATYPLKTISILQALSSNGAAGPALSTDPVAPASKLQAAAAFLRRYNLLHLYAGLGPNLTEAAVASGVYFFFYSKLREHAVAWSRRRRAAAAAARGGSGGATASAAAQGGGGGEGDIGVIASLLVATTAGALNQLVTLPISVVATRMMGHRSLAGEGADKKKAPTTFETIAAVWRESGPLGFWQGLVPAMALLANPAVQYMLFEQIKTAMRYWKRQRLAAAADKAATAADKAAAAADKAAAAEGAQAAASGAQEAKAAAAAGPAAPAGSSAAACSSSSSSDSSGKGGSGDVKLSAGEVFLAGALAKIGATVATYPLIVIKARLQSASAAAGGGKGGGKGAPRPVKVPSTGAGAGPGTGGPPLAGPSTWGVIVDTAMHEGVGGFFKGMRAKILQTALNAALMLMLKESLHAGTSAALSAVAEGVGAVAAAAARGATGG